MASIQPADPVARRRALSGIAVGVVLTWAAAGVIDRPRELFDRWLYAVVEVAGPSTGLAIVGLGVASPLLVAAVYARRLGGQIVRGRRFPPVGMAVVRPTPILTGASAVRRGAVLRGVGTMLGLVALAVPLLLAWIGRALTVSGR